MNQWIYLLVRILLQKNKTLQEERKEKSEWSVGTVTTYTVSFLWDNSNMNSLLKECKNILFRRKWNEYWCSNMFINRKVPIFDRIGFSAKSNPPQSTKPSSPPKPHYQHPFSQYPKNLRKSSENPSVILLVLAQDTDSYPKNNAQ